MVNKQCAFKPDISDGLRTTVDVCSFPEGAVVKYAPYLSRVHVPAH